MQAEKISFNNDIKVFLIDDPLVKTHIVKDEKLEQIEIEIDYPNKNPILYAFAFAINEGNLPTEVAYYLNSETDVEEITTYSEDILRSYIENGKMIYNGTYYMMIN